MTPCIKAMLALCLYAAALITGPAWAFRENDPYNLDGLELLRVCETERAVCRAYISGVIQSSKDMEAWLLRQDFRKLWHCPPPKVKLSDLVDTVLESLRRESASNLKLQTARFLVMAALRSQYPCIVF